MSAIENLVLSAHPVRLDRPRGVLSVDRVSFHYPDTAANALSEVSFTVAPGRSLALVGLLARDGSYAHLYRLHHLTRPGRHRAYHVPAPA